jgi:hypothetical protein
MRKTLVTVLRYLALYSAIALALFIAFVEVSRFFVIRTPNSEFGRAADMLLYGYLSCLLSLCVAIFVTVSVVYIGKKRDKIT